ncbi:GntR family transcriptional regulator [Devosia sediminis]|uniref:GntR family transcriptional regulator n=1 Tax=Devosia sediminis TaxID=2798801 RepID=A0A934J022_9HYPH|nr:GntR family transcriptional regulator [Devosia sediminis]MBJ3785833.1 GntR family transcriptional regulator [Devosia sediminis]
MLPTRVVRKSLHNELVEILREMIIEGSIATGRRIPELDLCEQLGISRTPLREALKVLASEGLVELMPNRGAMVVELDVADVEEIFPVVGVLESLAGELVCARASDADIAGLEQLHAEMAARFAASDMSGYLKASQAFHDAILDNSGNTALVASYRNQTQRLRRVTSATPMSQARWEASMREHDGILAALKARDASLLGDLLRQHLEGRGRAVIAALRERATEKGAEKRDTTSALARH